MTPGPARRWAWVMFFGVAVVVLVVFPFYVRVGGIKVKCGAPPIALSVSEVPEQCRRPAALRLVAAVAVLALGMAIAVPARRRTEIRRHRQHRPESFLARPRHEKG